MGAGARNRHIPLDEKLAALQLANPQRKWTSLDDRRVCALCEKVICGRMVDVWQDARGAYHLHCPTPGCAGAPRDWFPHATKPVFQMARTLEFDFRSATSF